MDSIHYRNQQPLSPLSEQVGNTEPDQGASPAKKNGSTQTSLALPNSSVSEVLHNTLGLTSGSDAIDQSGLVASHVRDMAEVAKQDKCFILSRPVNEYCTQLIEEGAVGKPLSTKHKSSDWGPMAGYIPVDSRLSKQAAEYLANPAKESPVVKQSSGPEVIRPNDLNLSAERLTFLEEKGLIELGEEDANGYRPIVNTKGSKGIDALQLNEVFSFRLGPEDPETGKFPVLYAKKTTMETAPSAEGFIPVQVFAQELNDQVGNLTADYDLFAICPKLSHSVRYSNANRMNPDLKQLQEAMAERRKSTEKGESSSGESIIKSFRAAVNTVRSSALGQHERRVIDPELGSGTQLQGRIRQLINGKINNPAGDMVRHFTEQDNPYPEQDDNILVITPDGETFITNNWDQTQAVFHVIREEGFLAYNNRAHQSQFRERLSNPTQPKNGRSFEFNPSAAYQRIVDSQSDPS